MTDPEQWLLTREERANPRTRIDDTSPDGAAWVDGNLVVPLVDGAAYLADLHAVITATRPGDLVLFTDWQGDADQRLTEADDSDVLSVFGGADERGVDVRGLVWRSHLDQTGFFASENRHFGEQLQQRGAEVLLDMRVRTGGSHHQKMVVVRHRDDPSRDVAWIGGIDLAHNRRDDHRHLGDPQPQPLAEEYGANPPWHDVQVRIQGPAVHAIETVFRERWEDPTPLSRNPIRRVADALRRHDTTPDPLPEQTSPPPPAGPHRVQLLRTYPNLRHGLDYPFARGGERSVARGYRKALEQARALVYVEDQYFWGHDVAAPFLTALEANPGLRVMVVLPMHPDVEGVSRRAELLARTRALEPLWELAPDRVAAYGLENVHGTPVYVHAKVCVMDDTWSTVGSDNFNRRSWTHDSELSCVVLDEEYATALRLRLAMEHLGRMPDDGSQPDVTTTMADCLDPQGMFATYAASARALDAWHAGGRVGARPPGHLRGLPRPHVGRVEATALRAVLERLHDPDGRPAPLQQRGDY
ncbi:phospholipase D family protein [Nocardioides currus]|uniref:Phospholipase n=1 Tax=Nocardioides currus TaxID=2133958 RepID=A0A2R7YTB7_9ACTN|nr:phospholipase D family protein [Nocardioides currus]PUA79620.1 phospholipase [Nocardioides currus]